MKRNSGCLATWKIDLISLGLVATAWLLMSLTSGARGADKETSAAVRMQQPHSCQLLAPVAAAETTK